MNSYSKYSKEELLNIFNNSIEVIKNSIGFYPENEVNNFKQIADEAYSELCRKTYHN